MKISDDELDLFVELTIEMRSAVDAATAVGRHYGTPRAYRTMVGALKRCPGRWHDYTIAQDRLQTQRLVELGVDCPCGGGPVICASRCPVCGRRMPDRNRL